MRSSIRLGALLLVALCACRDAEQPTQTIVLIDADKDAQPLVSRLKVEAAGPDGNSQTVQTDALTWPVKLVFAPKDHDATRRFALRIFVVGSRGDTLVTLRWSGGYVAEQSRYVRLIIRSRCVTNPSASCAGEAGCSLGEQSGEELGLGVDEPFTLEARCDGSVPTAGAPDASTDAEAGTGPTSGADAGAVRSATSGAGGAASPNRAAGAGGGSGPVGGQPSIGCDDGFMLQGAGCIDVDECSASEPCGDHGKCENALGSYVCNCNQGYESDGRTCVDIDECAVGNGGCASTCVNSDGGAKCECPPSSWLSTDGKACRRFGDASALSTAASTIECDPRVSFNLAGNGLAVWTQSDGTKSTLWTAQYRPGASWAKPAKLTIPDAGNPRQARVALDSQGRGIVAWTQSASMHDDVWAVRFDGKSFGIAGKLETDDAGNANDPTVVLGPNGTGFAAWTQSNGTHNQIWVSRISDAKWVATANKRIDAADDFNATAPRVALDDSGDAVLVWTQAMTTMDTTSSSPLAAHFDAATSGWKAGTALDDSGLAGLADIALEPNGSGMAVWVRFADSRPSVWARRFSALVGWNASVNIGLSGGDFNAVLPRVVLDRSGNGTAAWSQIEGMSAYHVQGTHFVSGGASWSPASTVSTSDSTPLPAPELALDPSGEGFAIWAEFTSTSRSIWARRVHPDSGFGAAVQLTTDKTPAMTTQPRLGLDGAGNGSAIYDNKVGDNYEVWTSRFE